MHTSVTEGKSAELSPIQGRSAEKPAEMQSTVPLQTKEGSGLAL